MSGSPPRTLLPLFIASIFSGAFLLFMVQPLVAKLVLPMLGGSPAVWGTCMVFFQVALLLGYLYAHFLTQKLGPFSQRLVHTAILAVGFYALPIELPETPESITAPIPWLLGALAVSVGVPFFALAATGPLLQRWFSGTGHPHARDPYFLYAASNAGSLLALLGYPLLVEPAASLTAQSVLWFGGYVFFCGLLETVAWWPEWSAEPAGAPQEPVSSPRPTSKARLRWVVLAFVPSSLFLGVTQHVTTNIAAVPLLWVAPLAIYLTTLIVAFLKRGPAVVRFAERVFPFCVAATGLLLVAEQPDGIGLQVAVHFVTLLAVGLVLHGRLAAERPPPDRLTEYYLWMAIGGALGGVFNALLAPILFSTTVEYALVLVAACFLRSACAMPRRGSLRWVAAAVPLAVIGIFFLARLATENPWLAAAAPTVLALGFLWTRPGFALGIAGLVALPHIAVRTDYEVLHTERTFFGVHRVLGGEDDIGRWRRLLHGSTVHGLQYEGERASQPTAYFATRGPAGDVAKVLWEGRRPREVAIVGLGAGTLAAYGVPEWNFTFYEIDEAVVRIARDPELFTFLRDTKAQTRFVVGDGRLTLARAPDASYDFVMLDAFSSDAIPVHLLTREAIQLYLKKLKPQGFIAFQITNWHVDLVPVLSAVARDLGLVAYDRYDGEATLAHWAVLARKPEHLGALATGGSWKRLPEQDFRVWTDDYSNLLRVLK